MEAALIAITVVSLGVALAMGAVAWRATNEERRRAAARVALLSAAARAEDAAPGPVAAHGVEGVRPWKPARIVATVSPERPAPETPASDVALHTGFLGTDAPGESVGRQRGLAAAAAVLAVIVGAFAFARVGGDAGRSGTAGAPPPLELLSLQHEREGAMLSVSGLVRNPVAGSSVERISVVVLLFDQQGTFVTSSTAPIDFVRLAPGDESPFVVRTQAPLAIARYRVSFRADEGTLAHVDRRGEGPAATPVALTKP